VTPIRRQPLALAQTWATYAMDRSIGRPASDLSLVDIATGTRTKIANGMEVPLYEDLQAYIRNSAVFNVHTMKTPLLIEIGDGDGTVSGTRASSPTTSRGGPRRMSSC
jgi:hypothetical protein